MNSRRSSVHSDGSARPLFKVENIFPEQKLHVHSPSIVELAGGGLLACWFEGSGERQADDVVIMGARKPEGNTGWSEPFLMASSPGFPDTNPVLFIDDRGMLWLFWTMVIANRWETSLLKYRTAGSYEGPGAPDWDWQQEIVLKQCTDFAGIVAEKAEAFQGLVSDKKFDKWAENIVEKAEDKYFRRMGWQTRTQPLILEGGKMLLPLYSDGFGFSLVASTEDRGRSWKAGEPLVSMGAVQPSLVLKSDGSIAAYMRDNGPQPKRIQKSRSEDGGMSWSSVEPTRFANPGSSCMVLALDSGSWLLFGNESEEDRHTLTVRISSDEGESWSSRRFLEDGSSHPDRPRSHYPTFIQGRDGTVHGVYSFHRSQGDGPAKTIRYVNFNEAWVRENVLA